MSIDNQLLHQQFLQLHGQNVAKQIKSINLLVKAEAQVLSKKVFCHNQQINTFSLIIKDCEYFQDILSQKVLKKQEKQITLWLKENEKNIKHQIRKKLGRVNYDLRENEEYKQINESIATLATNLQNQNNDRQNQWDTLIDEITSQIRLLSLQLIQAKSIEQKDNDMQETIRLMEENLIEKIKYQREQSQKQIKILISLVQAVSDKIQSW